MELNTRQHRNNSDRTWFNSFKFGCCSGVRERALRGAGHHAGHYVSGRGIISKRRKVVTTRCASLLRTVARVWVAEGPLGEVLVAALQIAW
jgi:hypothetical protein